MNSVFTRQRIVGLAAIAITGSVLLSACAANEGTSTSTTGSGSLSGTISGIGSSAQGAAEKQWQADFQTANSGVTVNYDPQGSGAGRKAFIAGSADFAGSDAALKDEELAGTFAACAADSKAIDLPVYISPIAIAYNVSGLTDLKLDAATIAGIFKGAITTWNDPAIAALNSGVTLPSDKIAVVHRSDDSGTTQNFAEYLKANAASVWDKDVSQTFPYTVGDAAKGTAGVADALSSTPNSIAYIDDSGVPSGAGKAQLQVGSAFSTISADGAADVVAKSPLVSGRAANDLAIAIDRTNTDSNAWPLVLVSYLITCQTYKDSAQGALVKAYAGFVASSDEQTKAATAAKSAPLASDLAAKVAASIATIK